MEEKPWLKSYPPEVPSQIEYSPKRLDVLFDRAAAEFGGKTALTFYNEKLTFEQLRTFSRSFAGSLQKEGVEKGDRLAILLPNSIPFVVAFYGALKAGAVALPLSPLYTERELRKVFKDSEPRVVVALRAFSSRVKSAAEHAGTETVIFTRLEKYLPQPLNMVYKVKSIPNDLARKVDRRNRDFELRDFEEMTREQGSEFRPVEVDRKKDPAVLMYTSGTTGEPKGVGLTHGNLVSNLDQIKAFCDPVLRRGEEVQLGVLPFFHIYGLNFVLNLSLREGYEVALLPKFHTKPVCKTIEKRNATIVAGVPAMFSAFYKRYRETNGGVDFSSLRFLGSGAAPCPVSVVEKMRKVTDARFIEAYGLTETSPITHMNPPTGKRKKGSVGLPLPGTGAKIVDPESGKEVGRGEAGELLLKGPQVFSGYWRNREGTEKAFENGWLHTKDVVRMDEEGYFSIEGRLDDMINVSGKKVWPREIEEVLSRHPGVEEAAVIGVPDQKSGQAPKAFVTSAVKPLDKGRVKQFCRKKLVKYKTPKQIEVVSDIPKSAVGKTLHYVLREKNKAREH